MRDKSVRMKLSREEELFLLQWMYDEWHFLEGRGPAKQLQVDQGAIPAHLATIIAAAWPDVKDQMRAGEGPPPSVSPCWPWTKERLAARVAEASELLGVPMPERGAAPLQCDSTVPAALQK